MNFRRALFVVDPGRDPSPALAVLRRVAPALEHLLLVLPAPSGRTARGSSGPRGAPDAGTEDSLAALRIAVGDLAPSVEVRLAPDVGAGALAARCLAEEIDLLVFASRSLRSAAAVSVQRARPPVAVLWAEGSVGSGPVRNVGCVALDARSRAAVEAFLRDHAEPSMRVALLSPRAVAPDVLSAARQVSGIAAALEVSSPGDAASVLAWLEGWARARPLDLLVFARLPTTLLVGALRSVPTLLLPPLPAPPAPEPRALDVPDLLDDGGPLRARVDQLAAPGRYAPAPDGPVAFVAGGRVVATVFTRGGEADLPPGLGVASLGVFRGGAAPGAEPLAAVEARVAVVGRGRARLVLFDAETPAAALRAVASSVRRAGAEALGVRMRPTRACRALRERLRAAGLPAVVLDARAVLDEGEALDVSETLDPVRLARVAGALRRAGLPVAVVVYRGPLPPAAEGFAAVDARELASGAASLDDALARSLPRGATPGEAALPAAVGGNRVEIEVDNARARRWLLDAIAASRESLHVQLYMALDDDVGGPVEAALAAAGARGVRVRVLVDSLHGLHGSFGAQNPLLARLSARLGVAVRVSRPITELPSLTDLKQRDHRKLVVADGRVALLGGRNLSHEYYTGFAEVALTPAAAWREVPWLDAGARVEGPAVAALAESFREAWREAGGEDFAVEAPPAAGDISARVVVHRGLRDARTLEAYRALIDAARSHVYVVNGFPLLLELQHALLRALGRGVRVLALAGHVTPTHGGQPFRGPWAGARTAATALVHSRLDPLVAAGAEVYLFARRDEPGWAPGLGTVHPHVHAKALSADGLRCAVGSANLDVTASYWESELLLVAEDAALARGFEARLEALVAGSTRLAAGDPAWREQARRRAWMRHWPGVLSV